MQFDEADAMFSKGVQDMPRVTEMIYSVAPFAKFLVDLSVLCWEFGISLSSVLVLA